MGALSEKLLAPENRAKVLGDCVRLIDDEVKSKSGITGMAIKGAYAMVNKVSATVVKDAMDGLLNDFTGRLEPIFEEWKAKGNGAPLKQYMSARAANVANALLGITDDRAKRASGTLKKAYEMLRPTGQKHVEEAIPRIGELLQKYAG